MIYRRGARTERERDAGFIADMCLRNFLRNYQRFREYNHDGKDYVWRNENQANRPIGMANWEGGREGENLFTGNHSDDRQKEMFTNGRERDRNREPIHNYLNIIMNHLVTRLFHYSPQSYVYVLLL